MLDRPWIRLALGALAALAIGLIATRVIASVPRGVGSVEHTVQRAGAATSSGGGRSSDGRAGDRAYASTAGSTGARDKPGADDPATDDDEPSVSGAERLVVHVAGAVRRPGVYAMPDGARVVDAVRRAGGATRAGDPEAINQAAELRDGQQVVVPDQDAHAGEGAATGGPVAAGGSGGERATPVDLNAATLEQLQQLDGVGPTTAQKILRFREQRGGIGTVDDLAEVPGIGPKKLEGLRSQLGG